MFYIYAALYQVVLKDTLNSLRNVKHDGDSLVGGLNYHLHIAVFELTSSDLSMLQNLYKDRAFSLGKSIFATFIGFYPGLRPYLDFFSPKNK